MTLIPLWAKAIIVAAALAALSWGVHLYNQSIRDDQRALDVAEYTQKLIAAEENARTIEATWKFNAQKSQEKTNELLNARDASYAVLIKSNNSLRNAATNYGNGLATDTLTACRARAATLADVFGQCADTLIGMAKAADGQYIDAVTCRETWPRDS